MTSVEFMVGPSQEMDCSAPLYLGLHLIFMLKSAETCPFFGCSPALDPADQMSDESGLNLISVASTGSHLLDCAWRLIFVVE